MRISSFTVPEINHLKELCNFTPTEMRAFELKAKDYTNVQLAMELNVSESTVSVIMRRVRTKITKILGLYGG